MKMQELEGVIKQIRYYGVSKSISDGPTYLNNLTEKEIDNILSMNYSNEICLPKTGEVFDYSTVFNNHKLLSSPNFEKILSLILRKLPNMNAVGYCSNFSVGKKVFEHVSFKSFCDILKCSGVWDYDKVTGTNIISNIEYILKKAESIVKEPHNNSFITTQLFADQLSIIKLMQFLSKNETSLAKGSHNYAMEKLQNTNDIHKATAIFDIQCSEKVQNAKACGKYLDYIEQAQSKKIVNHIKTLMLSGKLCDEEIKMILNAKSEEMAEVLYLVADRVLYSTEMDKYLDTYLDDMRLISKTENIEIGKALADVATSLDSISKGKDIHNEHMNTIYNSNSSTKAKTYANVILDKKDSYDDFDEILYNAQRFVDSCGEEKELPDHVFSLRKKDDK